MSKQNSFLKKLLKNIEYQNTSTNNQMTSNPKLWLWHYVAKRAKSTNFHSGNRFYEASCQRRGNSPFRMGIFVLFLSLPSSGRTASGFFPTVESDETTSNISNGGERQNSGVLKNFFSDYPVIFSHETEAVSLELSSSHKFVRLVFLIVFFGRMVGI